MFAALKLRSLRAAAAPAIAALLLCLAATQPRAAQVRQAPGSVCTFEWLFDTAADTFSLSLDDAALVSKLAFGAGAESLRQLPFKSNFTITACSVIDNVSIRVVPEPGLWELMAGGWALLGRLTCRRKPI